MSLTENGHSYAILVFSIMSGFPQKIVLFFILHLFLPHNVRDSTNIIQV